MLRSGGALNIVFSSSLISTQTVLDPNFPMAILRNLARVDSVFITCTTQAGNDKNKLFTKMTPASASEVAAHAYGAMNAGKTVSIHGLMNWFGARTVPFTPRAVVLYLASVLNRP